MFSTVFIDLSLIFVQLALGNFGKIVRDYHLLESIDDNFAHVRDRKPLTKTAKNPWVWKL